jgi:hypothetical protein
MEVTKLNKFQGFTTLRYLLVLVQIVILVQFGTKSARAAPPEEATNVEFSFDFSRGARLPVIAWKGLGDTGVFAVRFRLLTDPPVDLSPRIVKAPSIATDADLLAVGKKYELRVLNIDTGQFAKTTFNTSQGQPKTVFSGAEKAGSSKLIFFLRRTFHGDEDAEPALLTFTKEIDSGPTYALDFALGVRSDVPRYFGSPQRETTYSILPEASVEGRLGSNQVAEDAWRFRLGLLHLINFQKKEDTFFAPRGSIISNISWKYETDQAWRTEKMLAEWFVTPVYLRAAIGQFQQSKTLPNIQFTFRPGFGLEAGGTIQHGPSKEENGTLLRGRVLAGILVRFNHLGSLLQSIDLTADNALYYLPLEGESHNLFTAGIAFNFNKTFSLNFKYKAGEDAPNFQRIDTIEGGIGLKF